MSGKEEVLEFDGFKFKYILKDRSYDTNHLIIVFSGFGGGTDFHYDFVKALKSSRAYVLWIKDDFFNNEKATYYVDPPTLNSNKLETAIANFLDSVLIYLNIDRKNCTLLGCSKGGSGALFYGIKYKFSNIVLSAPTILIGSSVSGKIPKARIRNPAKFMLGDDLSNENIKKLDSMILQEIENDIVFDRNIYLIASKADPKYAGQVKPFLGYFHKYYNFNFIESQSILVRNHVDVTYFNAPLILSILGSLTFNLVPMFKNSIIYGDKIEKIASVTKKPVLAVKQLEFDENGLFYPEGVFFLRGIPCADFSDFKYVLKLRSKNNNYRITLAKKNDQDITKKYYKDAFVNYDKAYFCTRSHKGLDMSHVEPGVYQLFIEITMLSGEKEVCEVPLFVRSFIENTSINNQCIQKVYSEGKKVLYSKVSIV